MVTNQGEEAQKLSEERRSRWISAISRDDLTEEILENDRVCEKHFVSGRAAKSWDKFNIDWVPTLLLGHKKATDRADHKEAAAKRSERARERELVKKPAFEKRERELELERTAKRQKLNEPGEQVSNLSFEGNEDEEKKLTVEAGTQTEEFEYLFSSLTLTGNQLIGGNLYKTKKKLNSTLDCLPSISCKMFSNMFLRLLLTSPRI